MKTKVAIKNQNIASFGGIFQVEDLFNRLFSKRIDTSLGLRSPSGKGYQFSEVFCNFYYCICDATQLGSLSDPVTSFYCNPPCSNTARRLQCYCTWVAVRLQGGVQYE